MLGQQTNYSHPVGFVNLKNQIRDPLHADLESDFK